MKNINLASLEAVHTSRLLENKNKKVNKVSK